MEDMSNAMLKVIRELVAELHPRAPDAPPATLDSSLDEELAIDSLGRVELFARLQQAFHLTLAESVFADAETPRDLCGRYGMPPAQRFPPHPPMRAPSCRRRWTRCRGMPAPSSKS